MVEVRRELLSQSHTRVHETAKAKALGIFERLTFLEAELALTARLPVGAEGELARTSDPPRFSRVTLHENPDDVVSALILHPGQDERLERGQVVLATQGGDDGAEIQMLVRLRFAQEPPPLLVATVDPAYLWAVEDLPSMTELTVLNPWGRSLLATMSLDDDELPPQPGSARRFEWEHRGETYICGAWELPLTYSFGSLPWTIVVSEPETSVYASVSRFMMAFPLVLLLSLWVVLLLSLSQIRRCLDPLKSLKDGTRRIAEGDFSVPVDVNSGDEFQELAESFNGMSDRLARQFHTLSTMSSIDRAVLSTLHTDEVVERLLARIHEILAADYVLLATLTHQADVLPTTYSASREQAGRVQKRSLASAEELGGISDGSSDARLGDAAQPVLSRLLGKETGTIEEALVFPVLVKDRLTALLVLGYRAAADLTEEEEGRARQLADRLAVALANAGLVEDLDRLNWGSLIARARAIDAKSPWTAGHSERAAALAVKIARTMGLPSEELDVVHRGGLLHDIGKIGIPLTILDKKGKLTEEERQVIKQHPELGARILEPIAAYTKFIPVVLQHHEWYDGSGYPEGLSGEDISIHARIYSVADVYDALYADRPYRRGLHREKVVEYIKERSGTQFDPGVVKSFLALVDNEEPLEERASHEHRLSLG